jgi:hypothetical protein
LCWDQSRQASGRPRQAAKAKAAIEGHSITPKELNLPSTVSGVVRNFDSINVECTTMANLGRSWVRFVIDPRKRNAGQGGGVPERRHADDVTIHSNASVEKQIEERRRAEMKAR